MSGQPGAAGQQYGGFGSQNPMGGQPFNYMQSQNQAMQRGAGMAPSYGMGQPSGMGQHPQPQFGGGYMTPQQPPPTQPNPIYGINDPSQPAPYAGARQQPGITPLPGGEMPGTGGYTGGRMTPPLQPQQGMVPMGRTLADGSYGGTDGPQTPEALADMQQNHPVLYALRMQQMQQGLLGPNSYSPYNGGSSGPYNGNYTG